MTSEPVRSVVLLAVGTARARRAGLPRLSPVRGAPDPAPRSGAGSIPVRLNSAMLRDQTCETTFRAVLTHAQYQVSLPWHTGSGDLASSMPAMSSAAAASLKSSPIVLTPT